MKKKYTLEMWKSEHCSRYMEEQKEIEKRKLRWKVKNMREGYPHEK